MHITIERGGCISCGLCEGTCPSVFHMAEDGLAEVIISRKPQRSRRVRRRLQAAVRWPSFMSAEQRKRKGRPLGLPFCIDRKNLKVCLRAPLISRE